MEYPNRLVTTVIQDLIHSLRKVHILCILSSITDTSLDITCLDSEDPSSLMVRPRHLCQHRRHPSLHLAVKLQRKMSVRSVETSFLLEDSTAMKRRARNTSKTVSLYTHLRHRHHL